MSDHIWLINLSTQGSAGLYQFNPAVVSYTNLKNLSIPLSFRRLTTEPIFNNESIVIETILGDVSLLNYT